MVIPLQENVISLTPLSAISHIHVRVFFDNLTHENNIINLTAHATIGIENGNVGSQETQYE